MVCLLAIILAAIYVWTVRRMVKLRKVKFSAGGPKGFSLSFEVNADDDEPEDS